MHFVVKLAFFLLISIMLSADLVQGHDLKVASVDVGKIFNHWDFTIRFEDKIENLKKSLAVKNEGRVKVIKNLVQKQRDLSEHYQKKAGTMSSVEKAEVDASYKNIGREIKALERERVAYVKREQTKLTEMEKTTSQSILKRIHDRIKVFAKQNDYDMVIEMKGETTQNLPFFLHLEGSVDITDTIIMQLNQGAQPKPINN
jgi:Skp family chaperone for outer membrane proteins